MHGFSADRQIMSVLARRITENGYAVLAIDVHGHGANRNPFVDDFVAGGSIDHDIKQAVDFLRDYKFVDGSRIVVMGHSMGAGAVLDYSTLDPALKGAVMIWKDGGWRGRGVRRTRCLFLRNTIPRKRSRTPRKRSQRISLASTKSNLASLTAISRTVTPSRQCKLRAWITCRSFIRRSPPPPLSNGSIARSA